MELIHFKPFEDTDGEVAGWLHSPISEMETFREAYPAVVVCPGGAYCFVSQREADPVALQLFAAGYNVFVLTYSINEKARDFRPLKELSETFRIIRGHAREWHTDPEKIAVCGFSAGGHLAASLGTLWDNPEFLKHYDNRGGENRPNAMVLGYPVITADEHAHVQSIETVSGCKQGTPGYEFFSLDYHVTAGTCPTFLWHTVTDDCVPVENSLKLMGALQKAGVSFEAHLFPTGGHGLSVCTQESGSYDPYNARWMELCIAWLNKTFGYTL